MADNQYRSGPHRKVEEALKKLQVAFMSENEEFVPYRVDIYLPDWHAVIEVDGPDHSPNKDAVRDRWLSERYHLPVLHIKTKGPWSMFSKLENQIVPFLEENQDDVEERKRLWRTMLSGA